ncbi:Rieske (2Fe-2S) protein [Xanthobacter versatilis]|uniref:Rieske (2Fe-2S) protein n=1 Tax=Xanthobacter autotrophicus (strain ATCC BAA-1158 / Py2) TaxID=78245 RepID=UPI00372C1D1A
MNAARLRDHVVIAQAGAIAEGEARAVPLPGTAKDKLVLVRRNGVLRAFRDACPHYGDTPLAWRAGAYLNAGRDRIVCAAHGAEFDIETGRCVLGAALGLSLEMVSVTVNAAGDVLLEQQNKGEE